MQGAGKGMHIILLITPDISNISTEFIYRVQSLLLYHHESCLISRRIRTQRIITLSAHNLPNLTKTSTFTRTRMHKIGCANNQFFYIGFQTYQIEETYTSALNTSILLRLSILSLSPPVQNKIGRVSVTIQATSRVVGNFVSKKNAIAIIGVD